MGLVEPFLHIQSFYLNCFKKKYILFTIPRTQLLWNSVLWRGKNKACRDIFIHLLIYINSKGNCPILFWNLKDAVKSLDTEKNVFVLLTHSWFWLNWQQKTNFLKQISLVFVLTETCSSQACFACSTNDYSTWDKFRIHYSYYIQNMRIYWWEYLVEFHSLSYYAIKFCCLKMQIKKFKLYRIFH